MIYQIVISKLKDLDDKAEFLELTKEMLKWLKAQKGFVSYKLYADGINFSDTLGFDSRELAEKINQTFMQTPVCRRMLELVDADYKGFFGEEVTIS